MHNVLIVYHRVDLDGVGSAAIASREIVSKFDVQDVEFLPFNYGETKDVPDKYFNSFRYPEIYILDICDQELINKFRENKVKITIIDHHKIPDDVINELRRDKLITLFHSTELAAIQLTWNFFNHGKRPRFVDLLGDYDRWYQDDEKYWNEEVLPFQMYMRMLDPNPESLIWTQLYQVEEITSEYIRNGKLILKYDEKLREKTAKEYAFERDFEGLKAICCNTTLSGSRLFDSIWDPEKYDIMIVFHYDPPLDQIRVHLYSDKENVDCAEIARKYGGGGHKGAAGFATRILF